MTVDFCDIFDGPRGAGLTLELRVNGQPVPGRQLAHRHRRDVASQTVLSASVPMVLSRGDQIELWVIPESETARPYCISSVGTAITIKRLRQYE